MEGFNSAEERGIIPRAIEQIFTHIQGAVSSRTRFLVRASYLQIYNEVISDLLKPERSNLQVREDKKKGVFVEGLSEWVVRSPAEIYGLMEKGGTVRATGSTKMNELSSRSHAVFIIIVEQSETMYLDEDGQEISPEELRRIVKAKMQTEGGIRSIESNVRQSFKVGKLNLVDLAGSERVRLTGATGQRLEESKKINQSLSALGNVIAALTDPKGRQHIPYRDSKLTRILEDSLGGNCKTTMMAMISPALEAFVESVSTLKFANRAKNIKNEARINEDLDQKSMLRRYERELKRLRAELEDRSRSVVDQRRLLELDEQRRRAEEDKMAAIRALEARSREFMKEKAEKKRLEERIASLQSQMLSGGNSVIGGTDGNLQDLPAFRDALKEQQDRIKAEYEDRLVELEKERESMEEEKAQVDRFKQLLLKQRDIMILLTQRLNERDEQIMTLQDELDAYDRHQRELEEKLDEKTTQVIQYQRIVLELQEGGLNVPALPGHAAAVRMYSPYASSEQVLERQNSLAHISLASSANSPPTSNKLTAEEKISELTTLVESLQLEKTRLKQKNDEIQAEKVSMEHILRERLERLVQVEIESRLVSNKANASTPVHGSATLGTSPLLSPVLGGASTASVPGENTKQLQELQEEIKKLRSENQTLNTELTSAKKQAEEFASQSSNTQLTQTMNRLSTLEKERLALTSIMEGKIAKLVEAIIDSVKKTQALPGATPQPWSRELLALDRLVRASIQAMKHGT